MGRAPCCDKANVKKGPWSPDEDAKLKAYIHQNGTGGNWIALPHKIGLKRCGKSCRLRWLNYLRPNIKHGEFTKEEDNIICALFLSIGSRWSIIAAQLPGRTDNDIKNYWNTKLKKKLLGINSKNPRDHTPEIISNKERNKFSAADQTVNIYPPAVAFPPPPDPCEYHHPMYTIMSPPTTMDSIINNNIYSLSFETNNNNDVFRQVYDFPTDELKHYELVYGYDQPQRFERFESLSAVEMMNSSTITSASSEGTSCSNWEDISSLVYPPKFMSNLGIRGHLETNPSYVPKNDLGPID